jgi:hypothetical protein
MTAPEDEEPIDALSPNGVDGSLSECIRPRRSNGRFDDPESLGTERFVEAGGEHRMYKTTPITVLNGQYNPMAQACGRSG